MATGFPCDDPRGIRMAWLMGLWPGFTGHLNVQWRINRDKYSDKTFYYTSPAAHASGFLG